jgi:hypothetical protein
LLDILVTPRSGRDDVACSAQSSMRCRCADAALVERTSKDAPCGASDTSSGVNDVYRGARRGSPGKRDRRFRLHRIRRPSAAVQVRPGRWRQWCSLRGALPPPVLPDDPPRRDGPLIKKTSARVAISRPSGVVLTPSPKQATRTTTPPRAAEGGAIDLDATCPHAPRSNTLGDVGRCTPHASPTSGTDGNGGCPSGWSGPNRTERRGPKRRLLLRRMSPSNDTRLPPWHLLPRWAPAITPGRKFTATAVAPSRGLWPPGIESPGRREVSPDYPLRPGPSLPDRALGAMNRLRAGCGDHTERNTPRRPRQGGNHCAGGAANAHTPGARSTRTIPR